MQDFFCKRCELGIIGYPRSQLFQISCQNCCRLVWIIRAVKQPVGGGYGQQSFDNFRRCTSCKVILERLQIGIPVNRFHKLFRRHGRIYRLHARKGQRQK